MPAEDGVVYGAGWRGKHTTAGFRRLRGDVITSDPATQVVGIYAFHGERAGTDYVDIGVERGQSVRITQITPHPVSGRLGFWARVVPPTGKVGEARFWAAAKPVNGRIRVVSAKYTLDGSDTTKSPGYIYAGFPGASDDNNGSSEGLSIASLSAACVALVAHPKFPNAEIVCADGASFVDDVTHVPGFTNNAATFNDRRVLIRQKTPGAALCTLTRSDLMSCKAYGISVQGKPTDTKTVGATTYPTLILTGKGFTPTWVPGYTIVHPITGEERQLASSGSGSGLSPTQCYAFLAAPFSQEIPAADPNGKPYPLIVKYRGNTLPFNHVWLSGFLIDAGRVGSLTGSSILGAGGKAWSQRLVLTGGSKVINLDGFAGPIGFSDPGYPAPRAPFQDGTGYHTSEYGLFFYDAKAGYALGIDGSRDTDGASYNGLDNGAAGFEVQINWVSGLNYSEGLYGTYTHDLMDYNCSGVSQFNCRMKQKSYVYKRIHTAKYLVVDTVTQNANGTATITFQGVNNGLSASSPTGRGPTLRFLTGALASTWLIDDQLDDLNIRVADFYLQSSTTSTVTIATPASRTVMGKAVTPPNPALIQSGDRCVAYVPEHPDVNQWRNPSPGDRATDNVHVQGQVAPGTNVQVFFQDSEQLGVGETLDPSTQRAWVSVGGSLTVSGLTGTFQSAPTLNLGDFVVTTVTQIVAGYNGGKAGPVIKAGAVVAINGNVVTFQSDSTLPDGTYAAGSPGTTAWSRQAGVRIIGSTATFSSPACLLSDDMIALPPVAGYGTGPYTGVDVCAMGATTATLSGPMVSTDTLQPFDQTTWARWKQGKTAVGGAFVACVFENVSKNAYNDGGQIGFVEGATRNFVFAQITYRPSTISEMQLGDGRGYGLEDVTMLDSILPYFSPKAGISLYRGLTLDNNVYIFGANSNAIPNTSDPNGLSITTQSSSPYSTAIQNSTASPVSFDQKYNPLNIPKRPRGIVRPGSPMHGKLLFPGDCNENYLPGLAAAYDCVGARPSLAAA